MAFGKWGVKKKNNTSRPPRTSAANCFSLRYFFLRRLRARDVSNRYCRRVKYILFYVANLTFALEICFDLDAYRNFEHVKDERLKNDFSVRVGS